MKNNRIDIYEFGNIYEFLYTNSGWVLHQENQEDPFENFVMALVSLFTLKWLSYALKYPICMYKFKENLKFQSEQSKWQTNSWLRKLYIDSQEPRGGNEGVNILGNQFTFFLICWLPNLGH